MIHHGNACVQHSASIVCIHVYMYVYIIFMHCMYTSCVHVCILDVYKQVCIMYACMYIVCIHYMYALYVHMYTCIRTNDAQPVAWHLYAR